MRAWTVDFNPHARGAIFLCPEHRYLYYEQRQSGSEEDRLNFNDVRRGRPMKREEGR